MSEDPENIEWQETATSDAARAKALGQRGCVIWLTGLSGAGKSTIGLSLEAQLVTEGHAAFLLDGDNLRHGLCADLGFSNVDRDENIRRVSEVAGLFADAGIITVCTFISPMLEQRARARDIVGSERFIEVFVDASLEVCEERDPKGLYARVRRGEIEEFTGITADYEPPVQPDLHLRTDTEDASASTDRIIDVLRQAGILSA